MFTDVEVDALKSLFQPIEEQLDSIKSVNRNKFIEEMVILMLSIPQRNSPEIYNSSQTNNVGLKRFEYLSDFYKKCFECSKSELINLMVDIRQILIKFITAFLCQEINTPPGTAVFRRLIYEDFEFSHLFPDILGNINLSESSKLNEIIKKILYVVRNQVLTCPTSVDSFQSFLIMRKLSTYKSRNGKNIFCDIIVTLPGFGGSGEFEDGRRFQFQSFLGPFFSIKATERRDLEGFDTNYNPLLLVENCDSKINPIRDILFEIIENLLRNKTSRTKTLEFLQSAVIYNKTLAQLQYDHKKVSTPDFMLNLMHVILTLGAKSPISKVDFNFPLSRHDILRQTFKDYSINMSTKDASEYLNLMSNCAGDDPSFVTRVFFMSAYAFRLGVVSLIALYESLQMKISNVNAFLAGQRNTEFERDLKRIKESSLEISVSLFNVQLYEQINVFFERFVYFLRKISNNVENVCPPQFSVLPEWFVNDILVAAIFFLKYRRDNCERLLPIYGWVIFLFNNRRTFSSNPYLSYKITELFWITTENKKLMNELFEVESDLTSSLIVSFLEFFYDVEQQNDNSSVFYEKFNNRYYMGLFLISLWDDYNYKRKTIELIQGRSDKILLKFVHSLLNDTNYLIDECFSKIKRVVEIQHNPSHNVELSQINYVLKSLNQLTNGYFKLLRKTFSYFTGLIPDDLFERLANAMVAFLNDLLSPNSILLTVADPDRFHWKPINLTLVICRCMTSLAHLNQFMRSMTDERSIHVIERAASSISSMQNNVYSLLLDDLYAMLKELKRLSSLLVVEDIPEEDIPDEFLDPITSMLMDNPVRLPSGHIVDKHVIDRIILDTNQDPFSRQPLTESDLVSVTDLKQTIHSWRQNYLKNKRQNNS